MKKCPLSDYCGGCQYQGIDYDRQLQMKQEYVDKLLSSFHEVDTIIGMSDPYNYRNKVQFSFGFDDEHHVLSGYYLPDSHRLFAVDKCQLADEGINRIYASIRKIIRSLKTPVYDERSHRGSLKHVLIRMSSLNEYMVVLVTADTYLPDSVRLSEQIIRFNPEVKTVVQNINPGNSSLVLGKKNKILYGDGYITDELSDLKFRISPTSFYQVNKRQTQVLYDTALNAADLNKKDVVIDAYCGTGTIGLFAADRVKKVIGIELNEEAVRDADINKKINGIENVEFICGDAGQYMNQLAKTKRKIDCVIMDPPRTGSDQRFISSMIRLKPEKIIYISCNPVTLKRDLRYLTVHYQISQIIPVDMFPFTRHVETVVSLSHK